MLNFIRSEGPPLGLHVAFVYIREAHAADKWPMQWAIEWPEPQSLDARIACAARCDSDLGWSPEVEVLVDGMDDSLCHTLGAWPTGGYVLGPEAELLFVCVARQGEARFDLDQLFQFLRTRAP